MAKRKSKGARKSPQGKATPKEIAALNPPVRQTAPRKTRTRLALVAVAAIFLAVFWWLAWRQAAPVDGSEVVVAANTGNLTRVETDASGIPILDTTGLDGHIREALDEAVTAVKVRPRDGDAWAGLGRFYQAHMYFTAAAHAYSKARQFQPSVARWPHLMGAIAAETGDKQAAVHNYTQANQLDPTYLPTLYALGTAHLDLGQLDEANKAFRKVAELAPTEPWGDLGTGLVHQRRGEVDQAIKSLERVRLARPDLNQARYALALLYRDAGRSQEANTLLAGLEASPTPSRPKDPWFDEVMKEQAGLPKLILLANALIERGRIEEAEAQYRKVLRYDPESFDGHYNLGVLLGRTARFEESVKETQAAIEIDPNRAEAHFILAMAHFSLGQFEESEAAIDQSLRLDPQDGRAQRLKASLSEGN